MEESARFVVVLLLRHGGMATAEFSEDHDQFVGTVERFFSKSSPSPSASLSSCCWLLRSPEFGQAQRISSLKSNRH
jgi:hypothetical protein